MNMQAAGNVARHELRASCFQILARPLFLLEKDVSWNWQKPKLSTLPTNRHGQRPPFEWGCLEYGRNDPLAWMSGVNSEGSGLLQVLPKAALPQRTVAVFVPHAITTYHLLIGCDDCIQDSGGLAAGQRLLRRID